jgi:hypothetical protein
MMPESGSVAEFREQYRREVSGGRYLGWLHLMFTSGVSLVVIVFSISRLDQPSVPEWLTMPVVFLYANLVEYLGHRFPMHRPVRGLHLIYFRHTKQHHRFFSDTEMTYDNSSDFQAVLFPPVMILFFLGGFGLPMWLLLFYLATANVAWLALAAAMAYFLNYEWLHFAYHCDPRSRVGRFPGVQRLRRPHRDHHNPSLMMHYNFNITYPLCDWLFGTRYKGNN